MTDKDSIEKLIAEMRESRDNDGSGLMLEKLDEWADRLAAIQTQGVGVEAKLSLPADGAYLIDYDDRDRKPELFAMSGARDAAHERFLRVGDGGWNAHLYVKIASNSRDVTVPNAIAAPPAPAVPEPRNPDDGNGEDDAYNRGWNACREAALAALSQPGEVTDEMAVAGLRAYGVDEPNEYQIGRMRAALSEALGAQTRGERELLGYLYADDQRNLRQSGMAVIYEKKQIFHLTPKQSCIPVFAASPDQQKGDA